MLPRPARCRQGLHRAATEKLKPLIVLLAGKDAQEFLPPWSSQLVAKRNPLQAKGFPRTIAKMPTVPVGLSEVASILGVSRQRAVQLAVQYRDFPPPVAELAAGRVWDRAAVEAWAEAHKERRPGRPRRGSAAQGQGGRGNATTEGTTDGEHH